MSRIRLQIDRLVLSGIQQPDAKRLTAALQSELSRVLADSSTRQEWARSHRTPVLKLGPMTLDTGTAGAGRLGRHIGQAVGKGLKP
jgi:hypothetical protein